jgi:thiamine-phosphate pyrophosphorylase
VTGDPANTPGGACRLYLITPPTFEPDAFAATLDDALDGGDVACLQLRMTETDGDGLAAAARVLIPICQARDIAFLIDGRADIARDVGADGVHLAKPGDMENARRFLGAEAIVGVSAGGSRHAAMLAAEAGADYVSFGALHPSATLPESGVIEPDILAWWNETMLLSCVAVGGIDAANAADLAATGADFLAVCHGVWSAPDGPRAAVAAINAEIESARAT